MAKRSYKKSKTKQRQPAGSRLSRSSSENSLVDTQQSQTSAESGLKSSTKSKARRRKEKRLSLPLGFRRELIITVKRRKNATKTAKKRKEKASGGKRRVLSSAVFIILGLGGLGFFGWQTIWAPAPGQAFTPPLPQTQAAAPPANPTVVALPRSEPTLLRVPAAGIDTKMITVGRNSDNTMEVPSRADVAGWYRFGPTPGELGPSIIVGHVDSPQGPGVFWRLRELKPGDLIEVSRKDGTIAKFKVDTVKEFSQDNFPTQEVYGNISHAGLRLITCSGSFNRITRSYTHNTVVYATLSP